MNRSLPAFLILLLGTFLARAEFDLEEYKNHDGKTPLQLAEEFGKTDCVNFLKHLKSTR